VLAAGDVVAGVLAAGGVVAAAGGVVAAADAAGVVAGVVAAGVVAAVAAAEADGAGLAVVLDAPFVLGDGAGVVALGEVLALASAAFEFFLFRGVFCLVAPGVVAAVGAAFGAGCSAFVLGAAGGVSFLFLGAFFSCFVAAGSFTAGSLAAGG
jgi:hypothetical protein